MPFWPANCVASFGRIRHCWVCSSWNCQTTSAIRSTHILAKIRWKSPRDRVGGGFRSLLLDNFPRRETPAFPSICSTTAIFQFTSPRRDELGKSTIMSPQGDERLRYNSVTNHVNFNSRLRKETNNFVGLFYALFHISTHVSVRKRTILYILFFLYFFYFNSRLRKETNWKLYNWRFDWSISIHVSARRRTLHFRSHLFPSMYFNSRLREETNFALSLPSISVNVFQLTSPRGDELLSFFI